MRIAELFEKVLPYNSRGDKGTFKYSNGRTMNMEILSGRKGDGQYEISFYPADKAGADQYAANDAGGEELSIFQTVIAFVEEWYSNNADKVVMLYAEPSINDKFTGRRHALYTKLAQKMAKKHGGTVKTNGQFVMWYPEKEESTKTSNVIAAIKQSFTDEQFWEELYEYGSMTKSFGELQIEFNDANLQGHLFELEPDSTYSPNEIGINVDSDAYRELADSGQLDARFKEDSKEFNNMMGEIL